MMHDLIHLINRKKKHFFCGVLLMTIMACHLQSNLIDAKNNNSSKNRRVVVIGDLHGHYRRTFRLLKNIGIIDDYGNWKAKDTVLVQMGDIIDTKLRKGDEEVLEVYNKMQEDIQEEKLLNFLLKLQEQAKLHCSEVRFVMGNHEVINFDETHSHASFRFKYAPIIKDGETYKPHTFSSRFKTREEAFKRGGLIAQKFVDADIKVIDIIDDTLFVHAGINTDYDEYVPKSIEQINQWNKAVKKWLSDANCPFPNVLKPDSNAPIWHRPFNPRWYNVEKHKEDTLRMLKDLGCKRMVVGHTPHSQVVDLWDGTIIGVDTGFWYFYLNDDQVKLEALEIYNGKVTIIRG